jgi:P63C domain
VTAEDRSQAARELSRVGAAKGGRARANVLSPEERSEIARKAVRTRWEKAGKTKVQPAEEPTRVSIVVPAMPHSMFPGQLAIGNVVLDCHVLSNGRRVLAQGQVVRALTGGRDSSNLLRYLEGNPLLRNDLLSGRTVQFQIPGNPTIATGLDATLLIEICDAYLDARAQKLLKSNQQHLARVAETIVRACAKVGIIALIDEVTGYQEVRQKNSLQLKLQAFIADDLQEWAQLFPDEFWFELARLEGIRYSPRSRPLRWGKYVMAFVYDAVDEDVGKELRRINPDPQHRQNHHQWLRDAGREKVHNQLQRVIAVMKSCDSMPEFRRRFEKVFSKRYQLPLFDFDWAE